MTGGAKYWAVVPAAGIGRRMGAEKPKQYLKLLNKTVIEHSLAPFCDHPLIAGIVVAIAEEDPHWQTLAVSRHPKISRANGGAERCHSVLNGLNHLATRAAEDDWVLAHDAARPCVKPADLDLLIAAVKDHAVGGLLAAPLSDTVKRAEQGSVRGEGPPPGEGSPPPTEGPAPAEGSAPAATYEVQTTVNRDGLWRALTPQMFRLATLRESLAAVVAKGGVATDEAQAMESQGRKPLLVPAGAHNIKIARPEDLTLAEFHLRCASREQ